VSGRLILTSTTGAHDTAVNFTAVLFLVFCGKIGKKKISWLVFQKIEILINFSVKLQLEVHIATTL